MEEMIKEAFASGNLIEILIRNYQVPTVGIFMGCSDGCVMIKSASDGIAIVNIKDIVKIANHKNFVETPEEPSLKISENFVEPEPFDNIEPEPEVEPEEGDENPEEASGSIEEKESGNSGDSFESIPYSLFKLPSEKPEVKVVGRIDLDAIRDPRKKVHTQPAAYDMPAPNSRYSRPRPSAPRHRAPQPSYPSYFYEKGIEPKGSIMRIGPAFGFIKDNEDKQVYLNCNEILTPRGTQTPGVGDSMVFTYATNPQGTVAKCAHIPMTIARQLDLIEEIMGRDRRNARLLSAQLQQEFPDDENIIYSLQGLGMVNYTQLPPRQRLDAQQVLERIEKGEPVDGKSILRAEKELSENTVYDDYKHYAQTLLSYAEKNERGICYQLLSRMVKMARMNDMEDDAQDIIQQAMALYKYNNENIYQYFSSLRDATPSYTQERDASAGSDDDADASADDVPEDEENMEISEETVSTDSASDEDEAVENE